MTRTIISHEEPKSNYTMAVALPQYAMNVPLNNNGGGQHWSPAAHDENALFGSVSYPSTSNALHPSSYIDGTTPKAQLMDSNWNFPSASNGDWNIHSGTTPTRETSTWQGTGGQMNAADRMTKSPVQTQATAPMPIPERSATEPLWQRRLNAKNRELEQLHNLGSAPNVHSLSVSPTSSTEQDLRTENAESIWSQPPSAIGQPDHDFTHASPNTLRYLGLGSQDVSQNGGTLVNPSSVSRQHPVSLHGKPQQAHYDGNSGYGSMTNGTMDYATQLSYLQSLSNGSLLTQNGSHAQHSTSLPDSYSDRQRMETDASGLYGRSFHDHELQSDMASIARDMNNANAYSQYGMTSPPQLGSANGKGVISKVIVPSAPGIPSDAVDLRTGEAGQMRHMCPHPGCDKHFSTSGHARRHSRIHDCLRPFECPHEGCHATFTRRDNCTQHQRARHKYQLVAHRIGEEE